MFDTSKNENEIFDDVNFHLTTIVADLTRIKVDNNRNLILVHSLNNINERLKTIAQLLLVANSSTFVELANQVNNLFLIDAELSKVIVVITNHKRNIINQKTGKINIDYGFNK